MAAGHRRPGSGPSVAGFDARDSETHLLKSKDPHGSRLQRRSNIKRPINLLANLL